MFLPLPLLRSGLAFVLGISFLACGGGGTNNASTLATAAPTPIATATPTPLPIGYVPQFSGSDLSGYRSKSNAPAFYIDAVSGVDTADGRSPATAWKTLDRLHQQKLIPGDVVRLARGSVWTQQDILLDNGSSGSATAPVIFEAYGVGDRPTIRDPRALWAKATPFSAIAVGSGSAYITILDLRVENQGITLDANSHHIVIGNIEATQCAVGIGVHGEHQKVLGCYVHDGIMAVDTGNPDVDWGANGVGIVGHDIEVGWNRFVNCTAASKSFGQDGGAIEFFGWEPSKTDPNGWHYVSEDIRIHHNTASNCNGFIEANGNAQRMTLAYNLYSNSIAEAIELHMEPVTFTPTTGPAETVVLTYQDVRIENNTFVYKGSNPVGWGMMGMLVDWNRLPDPNQNKVSFCNNVVATTGNVLAFINPLGTNFIHDHNLFQFYGNGSFSLKSGVWILSASEKTADIQFADASHDDYRLLATSPAVDTGAPALCAVDLLGWAIPTGKAPDMGAYEFH
jgi:hypothetical protein